MKATPFKIAALSAVMASSVMFTSCGGGDAAGQGAAGQQAPAIEVMTTAIGQSDLESSLPATIKGKTDIDIRPQVSGYISKVCVDEGQTVQKGQLLFVLDQVTFKAAVSQAEAAINQAKAGVNQAQAGVTSAETRVRTAKMTLDNKRQLFDKNIISEYEWQLADNDYKNAVAALAQAKASQASAQAALAQANAALVNAKKNLSYTEVTAPCAGVVGVIPNREGSLASPSSQVPLTTISDNSQVYAYFSLTEKELLELTDNGKRSVADAIAQMPQVQLRMADGNIFPEVGKVATVSGVFDDQTRAVSVRALFNNPNRVLRSGATGNIVIPNVQENIISIPQKATFELQDKRMVYVLGDSNKVVSRAIEVLDLNDGKNFIVTGGLKPGEKVVIEGVGTIVKDGMAITPVPAGSKQKQPQPTPQQQAAGK